MKYDLGEKKFFGGLVITYASTRPFLLCSFLKKIDKSINITGLSKHLELRIAIFPAFLNMLTRNFMIRI